MYAAFHRHAMSQILTFKFSELSFGVISYWNVFCAQNFKLKPQTYRDHLLTNPINMKGTWHPDSL